MILRSKCTKTTKHGFYIVKMDIFYFNICKYIYISRWTSNENKIRSFSTWFTIHSNIFRWTYYRASLLILQSNEISVRIVAETIRKTYVLTSYSNQKERWPTNRSDGKLTQPPKKRHVRIVRTCIGNMTNPTTNPAENGHGLSISINENENIFKIFFYYYATIGQHSPIEVWIDVYIVDNTDSSRRNRTHRWRTGHHERVFPEFGKYRKCQRNKK